MFCVCFSAIPVLLWLVPSNLTILLRLPQEHQRVLESGAGQCSRDQRSHLRMACLSRLPSSTTLLLALPAKMRFIIKLWTNKQFFALRTEDLMRCHIPYLVMARIWLEPRMETIKLYNVLLNKIAMPPPIWLTVCVQYMYA